MKKLLPILFIIALFAAVPSSAETVTLQLTGTSSVSDGTDFVLPYFLSINGGAPISADCYDLFDSAFVGETWTANKLTLAEAVTTGQYSSDPNALEDYEIVGILSTFATPTSQDQIDLQHDLWNVFDPGAFTPDAGMAVYLTTAISDLPTFDFSDIAYFEGVSGSPAVQAFVDESPTPEPADLFMVVLAIAAIGLLRSRRTV